VNIKEGILDLSRKYNLQRWIFYNKFQIIDKNSNQNLKKKLCEYMMVKTCVNEVV
jgi:hypothetical protein